MMRGIALRCNRLAFADGVVVVVGDFKSCDASKFYLIKPEE